MPSDPSPVRGWLRLARCPGLPLRDAHALLARVGEIAPLVAPRRGDLLHGGLPDDLCDRLTDPELDREVDAEIEVVSELGGVLLSLDDERFPPLLRHLAVPPLVLTVLGRAEWLTRTSVAVVGSRRASPYGLAQTERIVEPLAAEGVVIVSGLARGIDAAAHRAALGTGGPTVAVMGTGPERIYPREHRLLAERIVDSGALVTEFPPGTPPLRENFPRRNRLIVGLALAVVVVEAAERSGSLVTARWAGEEGRPLLAAPGRAGETNSAGTLALLRDGASLACTAEDVINELPPDLRPDPYRLSLGRGAAALAADAAAGIGTGDSSPVVPGGSTEGAATTAATESSLSRAGGPLGPLAASSAGMSHRLPRGVSRRGASPRLGPLAPSTAAVLEPIPAHDEIHVDALIEQIGLPPAEVLAALFALELAGLVKSLSTGSFCRTAAGRRSPSETPGRRLEADSPI